MASTVSSGLSRVQPDPLLDGVWRPRHGDLDAELRRLMPALNQVCGPVTRVLLPVGDWTTRPHRITADGRTVSIGYAAGQAATMIRVFCADGGVFTVPVIPPGQARPGDGLGQGRLGQGGLGIRGRPAQRPAPRSGGPPLRWPRPPGSGATASIGCSASVPVAGRTHPEMVELHDDAYRAGLPRR